MLGSILAFMGNRKGNFAVFGALAAVPLLLGLATAINIGMLYRGTDGMQNALDSGLLAAGRLDGTLEQKKALVEDFVRPHIQNMQLQGMNVSLDILETGNGLTGDVTAMYQTALMKFVGTSEFTIKVHSEVATGTTDALDVALVLDNTASLGAAGLQSVKNAATNFSNTIMDAASGSGSIQMAVVPFAGAVNVGRNFKTSHLDTSANSKYHGWAHEGIYIAKLDPNCIANWGSGDEFDPGDGSVESKLIQDIFHDITGEIKFAWSELVGLKAVYAAAPQDQGLPAGYYIAEGGGCEYISTPDKVNLFDIFDQISNVAWGGCVEARADPYDTDDTVPISGNADTLFVPYFWPDEPDQYENWIPVFKNNYMDDATPVPWSPADYASMEYWGRNRTTTKYYGSSINLGGKSQYKVGPNFGCPDSLQPLTDQKNTVQNVITAMSLAEGGGTIISQGVMWGWRVLSPSEPFTQANTDANTKRIMVIMSDGENQVARNPENPGAFGDDHTGSPTISDYNAYGYLRWPRLNDWSDMTFGEAEAELDTRTLTTCQNAKNQGIEIYTVLFRSNSQRAINTLKSCATEDNFFYKAIDAAALNQTFSDIGASIGRYRLVK